MGFMDLSGVSGDLGGISEGLTGVEAQGLLREASEDLGEVLRYHGVN